MSRKIVEKPAKAKSKRQVSEELRTEKRRQDAAMKQRCFDLYDKGWKQIRISEEMGVSTFCVNRWLKASGRKEIKDTYDMTDMEPKPEPFAKNLEDVAAAVITDSRINARDEEQQSLLEVAENQSSPADKYQAYVAASAIKMLRDNLMNVRGPRTVRELSELDQLIRRNLGLNPKGSSGGAGTLTIDLSILNNAKAANGGASVIVDAEEVE